METRTANDDHPDMTLRLGSDAHKHAFCRMLLATHDPYKPAVIAWPHLDPEALAQLTGLPIWDIAVQTEGKASKHVSAYADTIDDPVLHQAIALNAFEEARHKEVLGHMVGFYGIRLAPEPEYKRPRDPEWAFMKTGFSECIDSFFAFGLFALAKRSGFFPPALVDTFEPVIQEECRHILFFVNWAAWHRRNLPLWKRPLFMARVLAVWAVLIWERFELAKGVNVRSTDSNFTLTGSRAVGVEIGPRELLDLCLAENDRRMASLDGCLKRPAVMPGLVRMIRPFLRPAATAPVR